MVMRRILQTISWLALGGTIGPSLAFLAGWVTISSAQGAMLVATIAWFVTAPLWLGRGTTHAPQDVG